MQVEPRAAHGILETRISFEETPIYANVSIGRINCNRNIRVT